ncbi:S1C family serine protease [Tengunoibacter tsumagoiensis]|uniref:PDZ domain-containing protein n=1 Tax=Tengunoibacter tsumagoiensis TaxID=2014871 RepID=A0A402A3W0_9CHLR|nr:trypsin-like peptidase domain-containing protein [Tengunoibacter tsumagoiensis]GCE13833.1 hypothetical protein KTT_36920 [Tengunoibacter tsumagoiensis]
MFHPNQNQEDQGPEQQQNAPTQPVPQNYYATVPNREEVHSVPATPKLSQDEEAIYPPLPHYYQQVPAASASENTQQYPQIEEVPLAQSSPDYHGSAYSSQNNAQSQGAQGVPGFNAAYAIPTTSTKKPAANGLRAGSIFLLAIVLAAVFGTGLFAGWQFARNPGNTSTQTNYGSLQTGNNKSQVTIPALSDNNIQSVREAVIANVRPAVVQINVSVQGGSALGSGVIVDQGGYIVTNNHVVEGAKSIDTVVLSDGTKITDAKLIGTDPSDDLAVIKINPPSNMVVAPIGDSSKLKVGQEVLAIGNPLGNTLTVTNGIVSALNRNVSEGQGRATIPNAIQTDAPINPGNSGGALVDLEGNLVGIPTLTALDPEFNAPANGVGFAIPGNRVKIIVPQLIKDGKVTHTGRAGLNVRAADVDQMVQARNNLSVDHGVLITDLTANGAAQKAGLQVGDVIVKVDNTDIVDSASLQDALISKNPGDQVSIQIYRGKQQLTVPVTLGELQAG